MKKRTHPLMIWAAILQGILFGLAGQAASQVLPAAAERAGINSNRIPTSSLNPQPDRLEIGLEEVLSIGDVSDDALFMWAGVAADTLGNIYVTDAMDYSLKKFDSSGRLVKRTGQKGQGPGEFTAPRLLAASDRYLFVTDQSRSGIQKFDRDLSFVAHIPFTLPISDLAALSDELLAVTPLSIGGAGQVVFLKTSGEVQKKIHYAASQNALTLRNVAEIEIDDQGYVYLAYSFKDRIEKWSPKGANIWSRRLLKTEDIKEKKVMQFSVPTEVLYKSVTRDSTGRIYVLSGNRTQHPSRDVFVLDRDGKHLTTFVLPEPSHCIYIDARNRLYTRANEGVTLKIYRLLFSKSPQGPGDAWMLSHAPQGPSSASPPNFYPRIPAPSYAAIPAMTSSHIPPAFPLKIPPSGAPRPPLLIFLIDFNDFMCPACLDSLLSLCLALPPPILRQNVWGFVVLPQSIPHGSDPVAIQIMEKKIRGFRRANRIAFPLILDRSRLLSSPGRQGTALLLLEAQPPSASLFPLPLSRRDLIRIVDLWSPPDDAL